MSIICLEGLPGAGKSYEVVVYHIIPTVVQDKRKVITNIPLNIDLFCRVFGNYCRDLIEVRQDNFNALTDDPLDEETYIAFENPDDFIDDWRHPVNNQSALFVVDEAQIPFRQESTDRMKKMILLATRHRHYGQDWILLTQHTNLLHRGMRDLIESTHFLRKKRELGKSDSYWHFAYTGAQKGKNFIAKHDRKYRPELFPFYQSHSHSSGSVIEADGYSTRMNFTKYFIIFSVLISFFIYTTYAFFDHFFGGNDKNIADDSIHEVVAAVEEKQDREENREVISNNFIAEIIRDDLKKVAFKIDKFNEELSVIKAEKDVYFREPETTVLDVFEAPYADFSLYMKAKLQSQSKVSYLFGAVDVDGFEFNVTDKDLELAHWKITEISDCLFILDHMFINKSRYVYCHKTEPKLFTTTEQERANNIKNSKALDKSLPLNITSPK